jgi:hypothetical protein
MPKSKSTTPDSDLVISYLALRKSVGFLGIFLPIVLISGSLLVGNCTQLQPSISHYYYTIMGSYFVGTLCAVSLFLFSYKGYGMQDRVTALIAAVTALVVAFCPTAKDAHSLCEYIVIPKAIPLSKVHYSAAAVLITCLAYFSLFLFTKSDIPKSKQEKPKKVRNGVYIACGIIIALCIALIAIYNLVDGFEAKFAYLKPVVVLESAALVAFGISWLVKGEAILGDK